MTGEENWLRFAIPDLLTTVTMLTLLRGEWESLWLSVMCLVSCNSLWDKTTIPFYCIILHSILFYPILFYCLQSYYILLNSIQFNYIPFHSNPFYYIPFHSSPLYYFPLYSTPFYSILAAQAKPRVGLPSTDKETPSLINWSADLTTPHIEYCR